MRPIIKCTAPPIAYCAPIPARGASIDPRFFMKFMPRGMATTVITTVATRPASSARVQLNPRAGAGCTISLIIQSPSRGVTNEGAD